MSKRDFYHVLGVSREADPEGIKKAYREAALKYHPDRNQGDKQAEEAFKEASEAYEALSDPAKRQRYDQFGHAGLEGTGFHHFTDVEDIFASFGDLFDDFFGFGGGRRGSRTTRRGADLAAEVIVTFEEAYHGASSTVEMARRERCEACRGSGGSGRKSCGRCHGSGQVGRSHGFIMIATACEACRGEGSVLVNPCRECRGEGSVRRNRRLSVKVPAGVDSGTRLLLAGEGEAGQEGPGDLYVFIQVQPDRRFAREGDNLFMEVPVPMVTAVLGGEVTAETPAGVRQVKVPRGTETGESLVLEGLGFPHLRTKRRGDLICRLVVKIPKQLTKRQEELMREMAGISGEKTRKKGFFS